MTHHGMTDIHEMEKFCVRSHKRNRGDRFGRLFPDLPPSFVPAATLRKIGEKGGNMDASTAPNGKAESKTVSAGMVIFGQFIDHDITLDVTSSFDTVNFEADTPNARTPTLDLDCIYGQGPEASPFMYQSGKNDGLDGVLLLTGADRKKPNTFERNDLARSVDDTAIIGDFRNDENRVISQMQLGMIRFHNKVASDLHHEHKGKLKGKELYEEARHFVTWHYQWTVVHDFLADMCGKAVVNRVLSEGRKHYCGDEPFIPIEFAVAAYRFGHSMVPMNVQVRRNGAKLKFFGDVLGKGFTPVGNTDAVVDWNEVILTKVKRKVQMAEQMDTRLASDLLALPFITDPETENSLATRNLLRGNSFLLPAGEVVARHLGRSEKEIAEVIKAVPAAGKVKLTSGIPLWLYILAEAEAIGKETAPGKFQKGEGLGPVGALIVAEVIIGLLEMDSRSFLGANRNWEPDEAYCTIGDILVAASGEESDALYPPKMAAE